VLSLGRGVNTLTGRRTEGRRTPWCGFLEGVKSDVCGGLVGGGGVFVRGGRGPWGEKFERGG